MFDPYNGVNYIQVSSYESLFGAPLKSKTEGGLSVWVYSCSCCRHSFVTFLI